MTVIDSDAHVIDTEETWDYIPVSLQQYKPTTVHREPLTRRDRGEYWSIDGRVIQKGPAAFTEMEQALREMRDIPGRLKHMDELGTDIQVLFPTLFLRPVSEKPEIELTLYRSYNRWLADIWAKGSNRLRWAVMLPWRSMDEALEEMRFGKEHGACAVFMRGIETVSVNGTDVDKWPSDPYFFPAYEEAQRLDLPVCIHAANGSFTAHDLFIEDAGVWRFKVPGINAFHIVVSSRLTERFPRLRFGFVELSAQWVPYALHDAARRYEKRGLNLPIKDGLMHNDRLYVACQTDDDIPYILQYAGDENLVMGTDYGHSDTSSEMEALQRLREMPGVSTEQANKILDDNPRALYGL